MAAAGAYRDMVDIQQDSSADGAAQEDFTGAPLYKDVPCEIEATGGAEKIRGRQLEAGVDYVVRMHHLPDIEPKMRLMVTGGIYKDLALNIKSIAPRLFRGRALSMELDCSSKL